MSDQAIRFRDVTLLGSSRTGTTFFDDAEYSMSDIKQKERWKVLCFIMDRVGRFHAQDRIPRFLTMPGIKWPFEQMVLQKTRAAFVGLEKSPLIYSRSRVAMPGKKDAHLSNANRLAEQTEKYGHATLTFSSIPSGNGFAQSGCRENRLLLMDAETYATVMFTDYGATYEEKRLFNAVFGKRTAVWLDYLSPLTPSVETTLRHLLFSLHANKFPKPVVITVMNCQDHFSCCEERLERMAWVQPALEYQTHWTYNGKGNVSMLTVCFTVK